MFYDDVSYLADFFSFLEYDQTLINRNVKNGLSMSDHTREMRRNPRDKTHHHQQLYWNNQSSHDYYTQFKWLLSYTFLCFNLINACHKGLQFLHNKIWFTPQWNMQNFLKNHVMMLFKLTVCILKFWSKIQITSLHCIVTRYIIYFFQKQLDEVALSHHRVHCVYFLAIVFVTTIIVIL